MDFLEAELPVRGRVRVSLDPATWPQKPGQSGFVPHWALVPDSNQPRQHIDPTALVDFAKGLRRNGQREIAKVRLLTAGERSQETRLGKTPWYMLVSGERRWRASGPELADLSLFEIRVEHYDSYDDQFVDAYLLNEDRESIPHLNRAIALNRILQGKCRGDRQALVTLTGRSRGYVDRYLALMQLDPQVAAYMNPKQYSEKQQLKLDTAVALSKLSSERQRDLGARIMAGDGGRYAGGQVEWIEQQLLASSGGAHHAVGGHSGKLSHVRERITTTADLRLKLRGLAVGTPESEFAAACRGMSAEALAELVLRYEEIQTLAGSLVARIKTHAELKQSAGARVQAILGDWIQVDYYDRGQLISGTSVSPRRYRELAAEGNLAYQRRGEPKPGHLPDAELTEAIEA